MAEPRQMRIALDLSRMARDAPDSILMAEFRNVAPGTDLGEYADMLAADLARHGKVTRSACAASACGPRPCSGTSWHRSARLAGTTTSTTTATAMRGTVMDPSLLGDCAACDGLGCERCTAGVVTRDG